MKASVPARTSIAYPVYIKKEEKTKHCDFRRVKKKGKEKAANA